MPRPAALLVVALMWLQAAPALLAQVFKIQGGSSTLINAEGASVDFKAPGYDGSFGAGLFDGRFEFGAVMRYKYRGYSLIAGDDSVPFQLPTDVFDNTHYFSARGIGISSSSKERSLYAMVGTTSNWLGTGFFQSARSEEPVAVLFFERALSEHTRFVSRNIVSSRQTFLESLEWQPRKWLKGSVSEGVGSNQKYFATGFDAEWSNLALRASYVAAGTEFRRVTVTSPVSSEVEKENIELFYRPNSIFSISAGHHHLLQPPDNQTPAAHAAVNEVVGDFHIRRLYFGAGFFGSTVAGRSTTGTNLYAGRRFGQRLELTGNYFASRPQNQPLNTIVSATVRENLSQRLSVLQLITRSNGQTTFALGGDFLTNRFNLRADYQNVYIPFRPDRPFQQALAFNAAIRITPTLQLAAGSNVAPDGRLRYTFGFTTYLYRYGGLFAAQSQGAESFSLPKFLIQGIVKNEQGEPVEGVALHIAQQPVYTDSTGRFLIRLNKRGPFALKVVPEEFLMAGNFEVVNSPTSVRAEAEGQATDVEIVIRRVQVRKQAAALPEVH